jgi:hypothetical protein
MGDQSEKYAPPRGPPPERKASYASEVARQIQPQGWSVLNLGPHPHHTFGDDRTYEQYPRIWPAIDGLFEASKTFFALPGAEKEKFLTQEGSEEGFSSIKGEKEFITLRRSDDEHCPEALRVPAENAWKAVFEVLNEALKGIELNLQLPAGSLTRFAEPCLRMDDKARATMLRLFRYENDEAKLVAERTSSLPPHHFAILTYLAHMDLGLLSLVIGDTPGLEAWDTQIMINGKQQPPCWHPLEQRFERGMATLMSGRQLQYLTRNRYNPGGHRVVSYGANTPLIPDNLDDLYPSRLRQLRNRLSFSKPNKPVKEKYRYSIVFVLRAHEAVPVNYSLLESPGYSFNESDKEAQTAGELFRRIRKAHFNINTSLTERDEQKRKLLAGKTAPKPPSQEQGKTASG